MADNRILARIARKGGSKLLDTAVGRLLPADVDAKPARKTLLGGMAAAVAVRVATRSVPGALVVGGGILAKRLYDRRHARKTAPGAAQPDGKDTSDA